MPTDRRLAGAKLTIDLQAIADNYRRLRDRVAPAECAAVVKADAYGLGLSHVAPALAAIGAKTFFVADLGEGIALRALLPGARIGVFNGLLPGTEADYLEHGVLPVLNHLGEIDSWSTVARACSQALPAFIHIDTGINRLGLGPDELDLLAGSPTRLNGIQVAAWISHFACADEADNPMTEAQRVRFATALARLPTAPGSLANSSGLFRGPSMHFDLVRPGCALYGINPVPEQTNPMRPVVRLEAPILQVRRVDSPMTVGYGATHAIRRKGRIATISAGYADGFLRSLSNRGRVSIADRSVPIVGRVSMDLITVDVSDLPEDAPRPGDRAELIGPSQPVDAVAETAGTIGYEILTALGHRYTRVYLDGRTEDLGADDLVRGSLDGPAGTGSKA